MKRTGKEGGRTYVRVNQILNIFVYSDSGGFEFKGASWVWGKVADIWGGLYSYKEGFTVEGDDASSAHM